MPRTVFGRRRVAVDGEIYTVENRVNGVTVRRLHSRQVYTLKDEHLIRMSQLQPDLFAPSHTRSYKPNPEGVPVKNI